jgi:glucan-binding YG repeat protein
MCDPLTIASIAMSAVSTVVQIQESNKAASRAAAQAEAEYAAAAQETKNQYQEANRQIAEKQSDTMKEESVRIREANEALGTLRATETALSDASMTSILFEEAYGDALNMIQIEENSERAILAAESNKYAAEQDYINRTTQARNSADNAIRESNARKTGALLNLAGSGLQITSGYVANEKLMDAASGKTVRSTSQILGF